MSSSPPSNWIDVFNDDDMPVLNVRALKAVHGSCSNVRLKDKNGFNYLLKVDLPQNVPNAFLVLHEKKKEPMVIHNIMTPTSSLPGTAPNLYGFMDIDLSTDPILIPNTDAARIFTPKKHIVPNDKRLLDFDDLDDGKDLVQVKLTGEVYPKDPANIVETKKHQYDQEVNFPSIVFLPPAVAVAFLEFMDNNHYKNIHPADLFDLV